MNFTEMINANYKFLNENDIHILKYVVNHKRAVSDMTIEHLADHCNVSRTTILRLCKKLDFKGYSEFKTVLKWDLAAKTSLKHDALKEIERSFNETMLLLKSKDMDAMCEAIDQAERVFIFGTGIAQRLFADELKRTFLFQNKYINVVNGDAELDICVRDFTNKDIVIIVSHSGNAETLKEVVQKIILRDTKILSITTMESNYLASVSTYSLYGYSAQYNLLDNGLYDSTFFYYVILEMLFVRYSQYIIQKDETE